MRPGTASTILMVEDVAIEVVPKRIRHMHLRIYPPGDRVRISAPVRMPSDVIRRFALSRLEWIRRHQRELRRHEESRQDADAIDVWGQRHRLDIREGAGMPAVRVEGGTLVVQLRRPGPLRVQRVLHDWYRQELFAAAQPLLDQWAGAMGVCVERLFVRSMRSRWGSCTPKTRRIRLSVALARKPKDCLEYIVVHELVHLIEASHNRRFVALMDRFLPDWRDRRRMLNAQ